MTAVGIATTLPILPSEFSWLMLSHAWISLVLISASVFSDWIWTDGLEMALSLLLFP
jgi:hypothetical protein